LPTFGLQGAGSTEEGEREDASPRSGSRPDDDAVSVADAEGPAADPSWAEVLLLELLENRPTGLQRIAEFYLGTECTGPDDLFTRALLKLQKSREARDGDRILAELCVKAILYGQIPPGLGGNDFREGRHHAIERLLSKAERCRAFVEERSQGGAEPDWKVSVEEEVRDLLRRGGEEPVPEVLPFAQVLARVLEQFDARESQDVEVEQVRESAFREEMLAIYSGRGNRTLEEALKEEKERERTRKHRAAVASVARSKWEAERVAGASAAARNPDDLSRADELGAEGFLEELDFPAGSWLCR
jgi:hypothetical protein